MSSGQQWWDDNCDAGVLGIGPCARKDCPLHGPKPPAAPEPQKPAPAACECSPRDMFMSELRALLATQGLRVVSEADWRVLEAMPPTFVLEMWRDDFPEYDHRHRIAVAELDRRGAK